LQILFSEIHISKVRNAPSKEFLTKVSELLLHLREVDKPEVGVRETANLWPNVFEEVSRGLGLACEYIDDHRPDIKALISRRNDVAHGKKVEVDDGALKRLESAVWTISISLALDIVEQVEGRKYIAA
jgi:hypothetical protein